MEKFFKSPIWHSLISLSLGAFIASIVGAVLAMTMLAASLQASGNPHDIVRTAGAIGFIVSALGFLTGIISLVVLTLKNL
jgi:high-affinity nickel permease